MLDVFLKFFVANFLENCHSIYFLHEESISIDTFCVWLILFSFFLFKNMPVPWRFILTSWPAWSIGITTFGRIWVHYIFIISGPMYMKTVLGFSIQAVHAWNEHFLFINYIYDEDNLLLLLFQNGVLSGLPFICSYFSSVAFCYIADVLITRQILSLTNVRKVFTVSCTYSLESSF